MQVEVGEAVEVLGGALLDDVEDVVDGDRAREPAVLVDHRHHQQVVLREDARDLALRHVHAHGDDVRREDVAQLAVGARRDQLPERHQPEQVAALVHHVEVEEAAALGESPHPLERDRDRLIGEEARHVGVHQPAGGRGAVAQEVRELRRERRLEQGERPLAPVGFDLPEQVGRVGRREAADDGGELLVRETSEQALARLAVELAQRTSGEAELDQRLPELALLVGREQRHELRDVRGMEPREQSPRRDAPTAGAAGGESDAAAGRARAAPDVECRPGRSSCRC